MSDRPPGPDIRLLKHTAGYPTKMSDRKAELERKKAKLQALKEEKERRKREKETREVRKFLNLTFRVPK